MRTSHVTKNTIKNVLRRFVRRHANGLLYFLRILAVKGGQFAAFGFCREQECLAHQILFLRSKRHFSQGLIVARLLVGRWLLTSQIYFSFHFTLSFLLFLSLDLFSWFLFLLFIFFFSFFLFTRQYTV